MPLTPPSLSRWRFIEYSDRQFGMPFIKAQCVCGTIRDINERKFLSGGTKSCGCLKGAAVALAKTTHGCTSKLTPSSFRSEYTIWKDIRKRCNNPNHTFYHRYGGRGLSVSVAWATFANFLADMGPRPSSKHSIDRIDNEKGYCKENCRWVTQKQQMRNCSINHLISYDGKTLCLSEWAELTGHPSSLIRHRLKRGWTPQQALEFKASKKKLKFRI